jgi:drug/metabolite transporter (DMT)-like permease
MGMRDVILMKPFTLALVSAVLFGAATPASKALLASLSAFQLAGLLYLGAALGVAPFAWRQGGLRLPGRADRRNGVRLLGAVIAGGIAGPVLLLLGLRLAGAASVSLWLTFELAATALLGAVLFREPLGWAGWAAVAAAVLAAAVLALPGEQAGLLACLLVVAACLCWALDNHLTALIDGITPSESTFWKGLVAGACNLGASVAYEPYSATALATIGALMVGACCYGASIVLYIGSAQALGATRAQVAFSSAPLFGVALSVAWLGERLEIAHGVAGLLFAAAIGLLMHERHAHRHQHEAMLHEHRHRHDDGHHLHSHPGMPPGVGHSHLHEHEPMVHAHPHWPDLHHRHRHH